MHFGKLKKRARNILIFFVFSTILLVGLSWAVFNILSASQSFISYHSLWTQSQQRAIIHLISYMNTENEQEYIYFRESVGIMKNIQEALYELNMDEPDIEAVEAHLSLDIVDQDEINNVIRLFSLLRKFEKYQKIFNKWENFHQQVELFDELGEYVYREVQSGDRNLSINELLNLAEGLNIILTEEQVLLLSEFRSISVFIKKASLSIIILISSSLLVIGFFLSRNWINGFEKLQKVNEEKDELAKFPSLNPNPVVEISGNGRLNYLNHSAQKRFPELGKKGMAHSYLYSPEFMFDPAMYKNYKSRIREVTIGDTIYEQIIYYLPEVNKFHIYGYDITKRKESQNNLKKALEEKEVLLAEIHHRVKNNLAIIAGLLELESDNTENPETRRVMQSSASRVLSMASVHEQLYANKSFSEIPFLDYVKELAVKLQQTLSSENDAQTIEVSGDEVVLN
ncbi:MAG: sensor histidine kinase, partial [Balneolaceae bacterium]